MGKKRISVIGEEEKKGIRVPGLKGGERVVAVGAEPLPEETPVTKSDLATTEPLKETETQKKVKPPRKRGKKYLAARTKIDPTKTYALPEAIKLIKETSSTDFDATVEAHLVTLKPGIQAEVALPHFQGKIKKVEIADEETLKKLEAGKIDFDILISTPTFMSKLVKYAKLLGPKGLMPNLKNGTIAENPAEALKKFQNTSLRLKTEQNAPLIHTIFGKTSQKEEELTANLQTLLETIGRQNLKKAVVCSTMGPGIRLDLTNL